MLLSPFDTIVHPSLRYFAISVAFTLCAVSSVVAAIVHSVPSASLNLSPAAQVAPVAVAVVTFATIVVVVFPDVTESPTPSTVAFIVSFLA